MSIDRPSATIGLNGKFGQSSKSILAKSLLGILCGLILIQIFKFGILYAIIVIVGLILVVNSLNPYRAWILLLITTTFSGVTFELAGLTVRPSHLAFLVLLVGWALVLLVGKASICKVPLMLPLIGLVSVSFLSSALYATNKAVAYRNTFLFAIYILMYVFTVIVLSEHKDKLKQVINLLLVTVSLQAVYGIVSLFILLTIGMEWTTKAFAGAYYGNVGYLGAPSVKGMFEESNLMAATLASILLIYLALLMSKKSSGYRTWVLVAGLSICLSAFIFTFTRASWIGFIIAIIILIFLQVPKNNFFNPRAFAVLIPITLIVIAVALPVANMFTEGGLYQRITEVASLETRSAEGRLFVQERAIERWRKSVILGNGTLSFPDELAERESYGGWLYSSYIQTLHDTGITGLSLLVVFQFGVIIIIFRGFKRTEDTFYKAVLAGLAVGEVAILIGSQASSYLWLDFPWIFSGIAVVVAKVATEKAEHEQLPG